MTRLIQSIFGGIAIFGLLLAWTWILTGIETFEWVKDILVLILIAPFFTLSLILRAGDEYLFGHPLAWLLTLITDLIVYSMISYLLIELTDPKSGFRCAIRGAYSAVKSKIYYVLHPLR